MNDPIPLLKDWLHREKELGAPNPQHAVLCTATHEAIPHGRVVAIREISADSLLFFTQQNTRKVTELAHQEQASLIFWLELQQKQVILEGKTIALSDAENSSFWESYPREAQIRFYAYAPTSTQVINSKEELENKRRLIAVEYKDRQLPLHALYRGFQFKPHRCVFYHYPKFGSWNRSEMG